MLQQPLTAEAAVLRRVCDGAADGRTRKRLVVRVLPLHRERCEVPVVPAGDACAVRVALLMARGAVETRHAFAFGAARDVREMFVAVVALLRIALGRVTIDAARGGQDCVDLPPGGESVCAACGVASAAARLRG